MKVICIDNEAIGDFITLGKVYDVIASRPKEHNYKEKRMVYTILNDRDRKYVVLSDRFIEYTTDMNVDTIKTLYARKSKG